MTARRTDEGRGVLPSELAAAQAHEIDGIRAYRIRTGCTLKEARDAVCAALDTSTSRAKDWSSGAAASPPSPAATEATVTLIVNGTAEQIAMTPGDAIGVLAHRALAAGGYCWDTFELRDEAGCLLAPRTPAISGETVHVVRPIGWGG